MKIATITAVKNCPINYLEIHHKLLREAGYDRNILIDESSLEKYSQDYKKLDYEIKRIEVEGMWNKSKALNASISLLKDEDAVFFIDATTLVSPDHRKIVEENFDANLILAPDEIETISFDDLKRVDLKKIWENKNNIKLSRNSIGVIVVDKNAFINTKYDENYVGYGREDVDFVARLEEKGLKLKRCFKLIKIKHIHFEGRTPEDIQYYWKKNFEYWEKKGLNVVL